MISNFFKKTFTVYRQVWSDEVVGDETISSSTETESGSFAGHLQQVSPEFAVSLGMSVSKAFSIWCPLGTDIKDGDIVVGCGGKYAVRGVQKYSDGRNNHIQAAVEWLGEALEVIS